MLSSKEGYGDQSYRDHVPIKRFVRTHQTKNTLDQLIMKKRSLIGRRRVCFAIRRSHCSRHYRGLLSRPELWCLSLPERFRHTVANSILAARAYERYDNTHTWAAELITSPPAEDKNTRSSVLRGGGPPLQRFYTIKMSAYVSRSDSAFLQQRATAPSS